MNEKNYLFNPFVCKNANEEEIEQLYKQIFDDLIDEPITLYHYAQNVEVYANLCYLIGEVIARLTRDIINLKTTIEIKKALKLADERKNWNKEDGKPPAMAYFEALATNYCKDDINRLADKNCSLKRFQNAYKSIEEKMNALKKKMESIKFEEFNN